MMKDVRIDKWLWAVRVFKTRSMATEACKLGRVTIAGMNVKPSHIIKVGDKISVRKPPITFTFEVLALLDNRVGAKLVPNYLQDIGAQAAHHVHLRGACAARQQGRGQVGAQLLEKCDYARPV